MRLCCRCSKPASRGAASPSRAGPQRARSRRALRGRGSRTLLALREHRLVEPPLQRVPGVQGHPGDAERREPPERGGAVIRPALAHPPRHAAAEARGERRCTGRRAGARDPTRRGARPPPPPSSRPCGRLPTAAGRRRLRGAPRLAALPKRERLRGLERRALVRAARALARAPARLRRARPEPPPMSHAPRGASSRAPARDEPPGGRDEPRVVAVGERTRHLAPVGKANRRAATPAFPGTWAQHRAAQLGRQASRGSGSAGGGGLLHHHEHERHEARASGGPVAGLTGEG